MCRDNSLFRGVTPIPRGSTDYLPVQTGHFSQPTLASATRMISLLPSALAARVIVSRETAIFCGSSKRSSWERLLLSSFARACFVFFFFRMASASCHEITRLTATASTSSRMPSSSRKLSKVEPVALKSARPQSAERLALHNATFRERPSIMEWQTVVLLHFTVPNWVATALSPNSHP